MTAARLLSLESTLLQELRGGEIHLWTLNTSDTHALMAWSPLDTRISPDEIKHAQRLSFQPVKMEYLTARITVRTVLSSYFPEIAPTQWEFKTNQYGRPAIKLPSVPNEFQFNISHSGGRIVCAVSMCQEVGVDIEQIDRRVDHLSLAESQFAPEEYQDVLSQGDSQAQLARFFDYWTLKEAYIKAEGKGLSIPLDHFLFTLGDGGSSASQKITIQFRHSINDDPSLWMFQTFRSGSYQISVAAKDPRPAQLTIVHKGAVTLPKPSERAA